ncbi:MAG: hypothetical protein U0572_16125 [Phycisphaerales bacterium]
MPRKPKYLPRFNDPSVIYELDLPRLHALLAPHSAFLAGHGLDFGPDPERLDLAAVARVILAPHDDTPFDLADALTHIHEMATPEGMARLIDAAVAAGMPIDPSEKRSPADLALQLWMEAPELLRRQHAEHIVTKRRSLVSFMPLPDAIRLRPADLDGAIAQFESMVRAWYSGQGRGDDATVIAFQGASEVRLVIRHGGPYQRKGCLQDDGPSTIHFRPMEFAYAVLRWRTCEVAINCALKSERDMIRRAVGQCIFGQAAFFTDDRKYTLEPLRGGPASLRCVDIPGIRRVRLASLRLDKGGPQHRCDTIAADDVFRALEDDGEMIPPGSELEAATLVFEFTDSTKPRPVTVRAGNRATYTRDGDSELVELFLAARGFMREGSSVAAMATA